MSENKIIWVTGAKGFVGTQIMKFVQERGFEAVGTDAELSVCEQDRLEAFANELRPFAVINAAGIRRDETSLTNRIKAYETNALGARNLALAADGVDAIMVQLSSDDVYNSNTEEPVNEFDNPHPNTPYGKSKRAGEMMVRDTTQKHIILRSSWSYHVSGRTFKAVLDAAEAGTKVEARMDQYAAPTSLVTYMDIMMRAVERERFGTFHVASKGRASRFDFLKRELEIAGYNPGDVLVPTTDKRTAENIVLESLMLEILGVDMPTWEDDLLAYMKLEGLAKE